MKYLILVLFFNYTLSQNNSNFIIEYNVNVANSKNGETTFEKNRTEALKYCELLKFKLLYKDNISHFFSSSILEDDSKKTKISFAKLFSGYVCEIYSDFKDKFKIKVFDNNLGHYAVKSELDSISWDISSNESKLINNFLCYKATTKEKIENSKGVFYNDIEAWFTPEIAISDGPLGFNGLPGLILELHRKEVVYGAVSIQINPKSTFNIEMPKSNIIKTEEEVKKMKEKFLSED